VGLLGRRDVMEQWSCIAPTNAPRTRFAEIPKYAEGLYDLGSRVYTWLVPNGSWFESNAGLIVGEGESLLVDTLADLKYTRAMLDALRPFTARAPLRYVVNTHADGDHFWGNELVASAECITSEASLAEMRAVNAQAMVLLQRVGKVLSAVRVFGARRSGHWLQQMVAPYDFRSVKTTPATRAFKGNLTLNLGGRAVELIEVGPAHSLGDLMVHVPDAKILFASDILFIGSTPVMWAGPVENWFAALDRILAMDVQAIVPGHGPITDKCGAQQVKAYWEFVVAQVRRRYDAGMSAKDAVYDIVRSQDFLCQPFAQWNSPERLIVSAHTLYRNWRGQFGHLKPVQMLDMMIKQAMLAYELPDAQPAIMRRKPK